jgi:hypothetical protein
MEKKEDTLNALALEYKKYGKLYDDELFAIMQTQTSKSDKDTRINRLTERYNKFVIWNCKKLYAKYIASDGKLLNIDKDLSAILNFNVANESLINISTALYLLNYIHTAIYKTYVLNKDSLDKQTRVNIINSINAVFGAREKIGESIKSITLPSSTENLRFIYDEQIKTVGVASTEQQRTLEDKTHSLNSSANTELNVNEMYKKLHHKYINIIEEYAWVIIHLKHGDNSMKYYNDKIKKLIIKIDSIKNKCNKLSIKMKELSLMIDNLNKIGTHYTDILTNR